MKLFAKKFLQIILESSIFLGTVIFVQSCKNYDDIHESYSENFVTNTNSKTQVYISEEIVDENDLLPDYINVYEDSTLCLGIPETASQGTWEIKQSEKTVFKTVDKNFIVYIPDLNLENGTYSFSLTVKKTDDTEISDYCGLSIFERGEEY